MRLDQTLYNVTSPEHISQNSQHRQILVLNYSHDMLGQAPQVMSPTRSLNG